MSRIEITRRIWVDRVPADPTSITLADPTNTFGVQRMDTSEIIVQAGTAMHKRATGSYYYNIDDAVPGVTYRFWTKIVLPNRDPIWGEKLVTVGVQPYQPTYDDFDIVTAGIPKNLDGCPVLTRVNAFIVQAATTRVQEFIFRDTNGRPLNLTPPTSGDSLSLGDAEDQVVVRYVPLGQTLNQDGCGGLLPISVEATIHDAATGKIRISIPSVVMQEPGIYNCDFGFYRGGSLRVVNRAMLSVEHTLFVNSPQALRAGIPTINELRGQIMDTAGDNVRLENVEFSDQQLLDALVWPIQDFNEKSPNLGYTFDTTNFPYRAQWLDATIGRLYQTAAAWYRRNKMQGQGGGVALDELNRDKDYTTAAQMHMQNWNNFRDSKKVELNAKQWFGSVDGWGGW